MHLSQKNCYKNSDHTADIVTALHDILELLSTAIPFAQHSFLVKVVLSGFHVWCISVSLIIVSNSYYDLICF